MKKKILITSPLIRTTGIFLQQNNIFEHMSKEYDIYVCCNTGKKGADLDILKDKNFKKIFGYTCSKKRKRIAAFQLFANILGSRNICNSGYIVYNMMGKAYGNILQRFIHRLLGISRVSARIFNYIFEKYAGMDKNLMKSIQEIKPDLIITFVCGSVPLEVESIKAGKYLKIPVLGLQYGWDNLSIRGMPPYKPDYMGVWSAQSRIYAEKLYGMSCEKVFHAGTIFNDIFSQKHRNNKNEIKNNLRLPNDKKVLFYAGNIWAFNEVRNLKLLDIAIDNGEIENACVFYRPHPFQKRPKNDLNFFEQKFKHVFLDPVLEKEYKDAVSSNNSFKFNNRNAGVNFEYLRDIFSISTIIVSAHSSVIIEGAVFGVPSVDILYTDEINKRFTRWSEVDHLRILKSMPGVFTCHKAEDLNQICVKAMEYAENKANKEVLKEYAKFAVYSDSLKFKDRFKIAIDTILDNANSNLFYFLKNSADKKVYKKKYKPQKV